MRCRHETRGCRAPKEPHHAAPRHRRVRLRRVPRLATEPSRGDPPRRAWPAWACSCPTCSAPAPSRAGTRGRPDSDVRAGPLGHHDLPPRRSRAAGDVGPEARRAVARTGRVRRDRHERARRLLRRAAARVGPADAQDRRHPLADPPQRQPRPGRAAGDDRPPPPAGDRGAGRLPPVARPTSPPSAPCSTSSGPADGLPTWVQIGPTMTRANGTVLHGQSPGFLGATHGPLLVDQDLTPDRVRVEAVAPDRVDHARAARRAADPARTARRPAPRARRARRRSAPSTPTSSGRSTC